MEETHWCSRENRLENFGRIPIALLPCKREACEQWEDGPMKRCVHLVKVERGRRI